MALKRPRPAGPLIDAVSPVFAEGLVPSGRNRGRRAKSSTSTRPTATASPPRVRMFSVIPAICMITSADRMESGTLTAATSVDRTLGRCRRRSSGP